MVYFSTKTNLFQHTMAQNRALAFDIVPIPQKVVLSPEVSVGGKYQCSLCLKTFAEQQHLTLHKNIHYFETPFRCEGINIFFQGSIHVGDRPIFCMDLQI